MTPPAHLVLVGLPGAGKSTHGRRVAHRVGRPFIDLDAVIEDKAGRSIREIFARDGEAAFRALEQDATRELAFQAPAIVAPGGGWVMDPANVALVRPPGRLVWLQVSPAVAVRRMGGGVRLRPLLAGPDPVGALAALLERRRAALAAADVVIDTELLDRQGVERALLALVPDGA